MAVLFVKFNKCYPAYGPVSMNDVANTPLYWQFSPLLNLIKCSNLNKVIKAKIYEYGL
jgi:hypothetical protein